MSNFSSTLHIEAVQTVMPTKPTDPRKSFKVTLIHPQENLITIFQRRFQIVLCYKKAWDEDSGWVMAGWIKESLGKAFEEEPMLAGRLRPDEKISHNFQIVSNDSGVRLVEAKVEMKLDEFLDLKGRAEAKAEAELVCWEEVLEQNPQFSPLFYVQVTNFSCGGYSIGISCSLLLADPLTLTSFLNKWAKIHNTIVTRNDISKNIPIFYLPNLGRPSGSPTLLKASNKGKISYAPSVIFKILEKKNIIPKDLAYVCIDEAEQKIGAKMAPKFVLLVKKDSEDVKVEICSKLEKEAKISNNMNGLSTNCARTWDELELNKICFNEGNKPVYVSCWINSVADEGSVMIIPSNDAGMKVVVTFT